MFLEKHGPAAKSTYYSFEYIRPGVAPPLARAGLVVTGLEYYGGNFYGKKFWMKFRGGEAGRTDRKSVV